MNETGRALYLKGYYNGYRHGLIRRRKIFKQLKNMFANLEKESAKSAEEFKKLKNKF